MTSDNRFRSIVSLTAALFTLSAALVAGFFTLGHDLSPAYEPEIRGSTATADTRPDLSVNSSDLYVLRNGENVSSATYGYLLNVHAVVYNLGGSNATDVSVRLGIRGVSVMVSQYNYTIFEGICNISAEAPGNYLDVNYSWRVSTDSRSYEYEIWALLDLEGSLDEQNESNNLATIPFAIDWLNMELIISTDKEKYDAGELMINYYGTTTPVPYLAGLEFYVVELATNEEVPNTRTQQQTATYEGVVVGIIELPLDMQSGRYQVLLEFRDSMYSGNVPTAFHVSGQSEPLDQLLVPAIVVALTVGVMAVVAYFVLRKPKV